MQKRQNFECMVLKGREEVILTTSLRESYLKNDCVERYSSQSAVCLGPIIIGVCQEDGVSSKNQFDPSLRTPPQKSFR